MSSESLKSSFGNYQRLLDCLKIAERAVRAEQIEFLNETSFVAESESEATESLASARAALGEMAVVALWAWFERHLIEYVQARSATVAAANAEAPKKFADELKSRIDESIEHMRIDDLLELFKTLVDSYDVGNAKQVKKYRDWIAHRNPKKPPPSLSDPESTYSFLNKIIRAIS